MRNISQSEEIAEIVLYVALDPVAMGSRWTKKEKASPKTVTFTIHRISAGKRSDANPQEPLSPTSKY